MPELPAYKGVIVRILICGVERPSPIYLYVHKQIFVTNLFFHWLFFLNIQSFSSIIQMQKSTVNLCNSEEIFIFTYWREKKLRKPKKLVNNKYILRNID